VPNGADGTRISFDENGIAHPTLTDGTPSSFVILGLALTEPYEWAAQRSDCNSAGQPWCTKWWAS
jgi:hypothetical protein